MVNWKLRRLQTEHRSVNQSVIQANRSDILANRNMHVNIHYDVFYG